MALRLIKCVGKVQGDHKATISDFLITPASDKSNIYHGDSRQFMPRHCLQISPRGRKGGGRKIDGQWAIALPDSKIKYDRHFHQKRSKRSRGIGPGRQ